jgi:hypothetical protein
VSFGAPISGWRRSTIRPRRLIGADGPHSGPYGLVDQTGSEHTQKAVNHFGMEVDDLALVYENAIAAGAKAEMPPSTVTSGDGCGLDMMSFRGVCSKLL